MRARSRLAAVTGVAVVSLLAAAAVGPSVVGAATPDARSEHQRIVRFWTKERVAAARPRDVTLARPGVAPLAKPVKPGPSTPPTITGAQWPDGQGVIYRATGRILFAMAGGYWICSGTVVTDTRTDRSIVLTAAHCAYDQANKVFATEWMFIPEFDTSPLLWPDTCASTAWGCWTASSLVVSAGFANRSGFDTTAAQYDWAFAVLGTGGTGGTALDATVGSFPIAFSSVSSGTSVAAFGYPGAAQYDGTELIWSQGSLAFDMWTFNRTYRLGSTMTGGASGGPWLRSFASSGDTGTLMSVNSYKYGDAPSMYGPKFGSGTQAAWNAAQTTATSVVVP